MKLFSFLQNKNNSEQPSNNKAASQGINDVFDIQRGFTPSVQPIKFALEVVGMILGALVIVIATLVYFKFY